MAANLIFRSWDADARASAIVRTLQDTPVDLLPDTPGMVRARVIARGAFGMLFASAMWRLLHGP